jgi:predicted GH43/DUF377 family glycosyl hydrolase
MSVLASLLVLAPPQTAPLQRLEAKDAGIVLEYGKGPGGCDQYGARDAWVFESGGTYYMHYDAAGPEGWLAALATSEDLTKWERKGTALSLGAPGADDSASASYGVVEKVGRAWHMFYLGTPNATPPPDRVPSFPYLTMKALALFPDGPWVKQPEVVPFRPKTGTYYAVTASPGQVVRHGEEFLQFFSASAYSRAGVLQRTLGIARTKSLNTPWSVDPSPILPPSEQIENASLYFEPTNGTWFLFTNHVASENGLEYTDAVWVYWSRDLLRWDPRNKAVVLDGTNCTWSKKCIGLPSVLRVGDRLAVFYDAPGGEDTGHMRRSIGLAWLDLPLRP